MHHDIVYVYIRLYKYLFSYARASLWILFFFLYSFSAEKTTITQETLRVFRISLCPIACRREDKAAGIREDKGHGENEEEKLSDVNALRNNEKKSLALSPAHTCKHKVVRRNSIIRCC